MVLKKRNYSRLSLYIMSAGWAGAAIYLFFMFDFDESGKILKHFLSTESSGVRFRALVFFTPLITTIIAYLVHERDKFLRRTLASKEELQSYNERLSALRSIDMAISSSIDLQATLRIFIDKVVSQLKADAASVLLFSPDTLLLVYSAGSGFRTDGINKVRLKLGEGLAGEAALKREEVIVSDISDASGRGSGLAVEKFIKSFLYGEEGFRSYIGKPLIAQGRVKGVLEVFNRNTFNPPREWLEFLDAFTGQAAIAIEKASLFTDLQMSNIELVNAYNTTIEGWARALDYRDKETEGHSRRVTEMTVQIAQIMGISDEELVHVRRGALLHDIGKMGIPDRILLKPGPLDDEEYEIMKRHPDISYNLLYPIAFLRACVDIPYYHHEKWDGTGYPRGLKGEDIPLPARIFSVVDVWDALRSDRPYRKGWTKEKTVEHIHSLSGTDFDPNVVDIFIREIAGREDETSLPQK
jgi:HD-GYP domain-containing protein (c-di-GMP phosphodiesterase class II)